jgi:hypothetical protein
MAGEGESSGKRIESDNLVRQTFQAAVGGVPVIVLPAPAGLPVTAHAGGRR